jgi:hypothetical protein
VRSLPLVVAFRGASVGMLFTKTVQLPRVILLSLSEAEKTRVLPKKDHTFLNPVTSLRILKILKVTQV